VSGAAPAGGYRCVLCGYETAHPAPTELGHARGNTRRFRGTQFTLWKCPRCATIHSVDPVDLADIYGDYPLNSGRRLDMFARGTLANLLGRVEAAGLHKGDTVLDYGCGNGVAIAFLRDRGYSSVAGFDPFVAEYARLPEGSGEYGCVIANDVLEHVEDPRATLRACLELVRPGGLLYVGTADSQGVRSMADLEPHLMRLHQPFHRVIMTQEGLLGLGRELGLDLVRSWRRSYMDTLRPFVNYRFLDEFNRALGHEMDLAFDPAAGKILMRKPSLFLYAFFGYFFPSAAEPAALWRRPAGASKAGRTEPVPKSEQH